MSSYTGGEVAFGGNSAPLRYLTDNAVPLREGAGGGDADGSPSWRHAAALVDVRRDGGDSSHTSPSRDGDRCISVVWN